MRLNKIEIENIASLRGKHEIDFDYLAQTSNLFAITGQTGSGKSTILNSISLALFGKIYKNSLNQKDLISLGEASGKIKLTFTIRYQKYMCEWYCRVRQKNGELLKKAEIPPRKIFVFKNKQYEILEKEIEDIIGLDFDQFCKTTILNQGEFSKFLTSNFTDRKIILEKLYASNYLNKLSPILYNQVKELESEKKQIEEKIGLLTQISQEEKKSLEIKLENQKSFEKANKEVNNVTQQLIGFLKENLSLFEKRDKNNIRIEDFSKNIENLTNQKNVLLNEHTKQNEKLNKIQQAYKEAKPQLQEAILKYNELKNQQQNKDKIIKRNLFLENEIIKTKKILHETNEAKIKNKNEINQIKSTLKSKNIDELLNLENDLIIKDIKISSEKEKRLHFEKNSLLKEQRANLETLNKNLEEKSKLESLINELKLTNPLCFNKSDLEEELQNKLNEIQKEISSLEFLKEQYVENIKQIEIKNKQIKELKELLHKRSQPIDEMRNELKTLGDYQIELNEITTIKNLLNSSKNIGHCVLCESVTKQDHIEIKLNKINKLLSKNLSDKTNELQTIQEEVYSTNLKLENILDQVYKIEKNNKDIFYKINCLKIREYFNKELNESIAQISELLTYAKDKSAKLQKQIIKNKDDKILLEKYLVNLTHLEEINSNANNSNIDLKVKIEKINEDINIELEQLKKMADTLKIKFPDYTEDIISEFESDKNKAHILKLKASEERSFEQKLNLFNDNLLKFITEKNENSIELSKIDITINDIQIEVNKITNGNSPVDIINQFENNIAKETDKSKKIELDLNNIKSQIVEHESKIDILKENQENIQQSYQLKQIKINEYSDILIEKIKFSTEYFDYLNIEQLIRISEKLKKLNNIENITSLIYEESTQQFLNINDLTINKIKQNNDEMVRINTILADEEKRSKQREVFQDKINSLEVTLENKKKLQLLIGKDEFRNYVLGQIEINLLKQTNYELKSLYSGRYKLVQIGNKKPEFFVIDKLLGGMKRKIATLSGGETFLVSLAMALGLAEMTRGNTVIDSFFIDEGFGTLDKDSLEEVIEVLNNLKDKGKTIGIISHIRDLTSRIPVNLNLTKGQSGKSEINYIYN